MSTQVRMLIEKALEIMYGETHDDLYVPLMTDRGYIPMYLADTEYTIETRLNYVTEFARMKFMVRIFTLILSIFDREQMYRYFYLICLIFISLIVHCFCVCRQRIFVNQTSTWRIY